MSYDYRDPVARKIARAKARLRAKQRNLAGLCYFCRTPTVDGLMVCAKHRDYQREKMNANRRARGVPMRGPTPTPEAVRDRDRKRKRRWIERKLEHQWCVSCGRERPRPGKKTCEPCRERSAKWSREYMRRKRGYKGRAQPTPAPRRIAPPRWDFAEDFEPVAASKDPMQRLREAHRRLLARRGA